MQPTLIQKLEQQGMPLFGKFFIKSLRENCQVESLHSETISVQDFIDTHKETSYVVGFGDKNKNYYFIEWSPKLFFTLHDRQLGGTRDPYIKPFTERLSKVEQTNMLSFSKEMMFVFNQFLHQHKSIDVSPQLIELPMDFVRIPPTEKLDCITFEVESTFGGPFSLYISTTLA